MILMSLKPYTSTSTRLFGLLICGEFSSLIAMLGYKRCGRFEMTDIQFASRGEHKIAEALIKSYWALLYVKPDLINFTSTLINLVTQLQALYTLTWAAA